MSDTTPGTTLSFILFAAGALLLAVGSSWATFATMRADWPVLVKISLLAVVGVVSAMLGAAVLTLGGLHDPLVTPILIGMLILAAMAVAVITAAVEVRVEQAVAATVSSAQTAGPMTPAPWSWNG